MPTTLRSERKGNDEIRLIQDTDYYLEMLRDDVVLTHQEVAEASHPEMALEYYESLLPVWLNAR
jgi:hypothetical protein